MGQIVIGEQCDFKPFRNADAEFVSAGGDG